MSTTVANVNDPDLLVREGWGDSVEDIAECWGNSFIDDIHNRVTAWMKQERGHI